MRLFWSLAITCAVISWADCALSQRRPIADDTLGEERSIVTPEANIRGLPGDRIRGGARRGNNLFHSFREFNVGVGRAVYFDDPGVQNILSRVTGGNVSEILGRLGVLGNANLFLINPNGIIFGPGAQLDVRGSFVATTADAIQFGNQGFFSASAPNAPPLLTVQPSAFLFNQLQRGAIENRSASLRVPNNQNLLLIGGNISMDGGALNAYGGRVEIGGLLEPGAIALNTDESLTFPIGVGRSDVSLIRGALIDVAAGDGGTITINARNIGILGRSILGAGIYQNLGLVSAQAGDITLNATGRVEIANSTIINFVSLGTLGNGGNITITAGSMDLKETFLGGGILGRGNAGNITLSIADTLSLDNSDISSQIRQDAVGNAGNITISAGSVTLDNGTAISSNALGEGNSGNIILTVSDTLSLAGLNSDGFDGISNIRSGVFEGVGDAGNITITAHSIQLSDGAGIISGTSGEGNAGNITLTVADVLSLAGRNGKGEGSQIGADLVGGLGNAGDITITARSIRLNDGATLTSLAAGKGNAGNITLNVADTLSLAGRDGDGNASVIGGFLAEGVGNAGNLTIIAGSIRLNDGARLSSFTDGEGNAGNITLDIADTLSLAGRDGKGFGSSISSEVSEEATGNGGNIRINAGSVVLEDGTDISSSTLGKGNAGNIFVIADSITVGNASFGSSTFSEGNAGNITLDIADTLSLIGGGNERLSSYISSAVSENAVGNGGNIAITARSIVLEDGGGIFSNTFREGNAGSITMTADSIHLENRAFINSSTSGRGDAGNITLNVADTLSLSGLDSDGNSSFIQSAVDREARGNGGEIAITAGSMTLKDGAGIFTNTFGEGNAGNIILNVRDVLSLTERDGDGRGSRIESSVAAIAEGNQGTIAIATDALSLVDGARLTVNNAAPRGEGGDIEIQAHSVELDEASQITAETASGQGGNLTLINTELLQLRNGSFISTSAGRQQAVGDGGNINIDADFILAFPNENSDIRADAFTGSGGNIDITTEGLFGIAARDRPTRFSDITASSELGVQGTININTPDVDPSRGLTELPENVVDASDQVAQTCPADGDIAGEVGEFVVTGRGGLPADPAELLGGETVLSELAEVPDGDAEGDRQEEGMRRMNDRPSTVANPTEIVEAQGWVVGAEGQVMLTAEYPAVEPHRLPIAPVACPRS